MANDEGGENTAILLTGCTCKKFLDLIKLLNLVELKTQHGTAK